MDALLPLLLLLLATRLYVLSSFCLASLMVYFFEAAAY